MMKILILHTLKVALQNIFVVHPVIDHGESTNLGEKIVQINNENHISAAGGPDISLI